MAKRSFEQRWNDYRPPKAAVFWAFVVGVALPIVIGFNWGGWVTGGTAQEMSRAASDRARAELVASACVERFMNAADASSQLTALRTADSWQRNTFIEKGGWVTLAGMDTPTRAAASLCVERLMAVGSPAAADG